MLPYIASTDVCANSSDSKHHASSVTGISNDGYCICVCEECGNEFTSSTLASDAYDDFTISLPAQEINSDGGFYWYPTVDDCTAITIGDGGHDTQLSSPSYKGDYVTLRDDRRSWSYIRNDATNATHGFTSLKITVPIDGIYTVSDSVFLSGFDNLGNFEDYFPSNSYVKASGSLIEMSGVWKKHSYDFINWFYYLPFFLVSPITPYDVTSSSVNDTYNINTRAATISGDFGMITQSGDIQKIGSRSIVNETNNMYYSPSTGEPQEFTDWTYDYSDRSYNLTTTSGDKTTITYGDEYCTIKEGDTITNIYYLIENSVDNSSGENNNGNGGSGNGAGVLPHFHNYIGSVTVEPECVLPGVKTYTCACGDSYSEAIPATGHRWQVTKRVTTSYDEETSELLEQGYVIYQCSVCGEQYKSDDGAVPPNSYAVGGTASESSGGTIWGKLGTLLGTIALAPLRVIESILGVLLDGLISLAQVITERLGTLLEMVLGWFDTLPDLFSGFSSFLSAVFVFLPEEMITLLVFGLAAVVFVAIIKAIRGR